MRTQLRKLYDRGGMRVVAVLAVVMGLSLAWVPGAQAAGNVTVSVEDGDLIIRGDDRDNNIMVLIGTGGTSVRGRAGTTVNGGSGGEFSFSDDLDINMKGGNDFVRVETRVFNQLAIPGDLQIETGSGADIIELLYVVVTGKTRMATGDGNDIVFIDGVADLNQVFNQPDFMGKFALKTGSGKDFVEMHQAIFRGEVDVRLGSGDDNACAINSEFQQPDQAKFDGGDGFDGMPGAGVLRIGFENDPDDCSFLGGRDD